jgi:hypothetical protein
LIERPLSLAKVMDGIADGSLRFDTSTTPEEDDASCYVDYCGCCDNEIPDDGGDDGPLWCTRCESHVGAQGGSWDRTYEAVHGRPCPFQVAR